MNTRIGMVCFLIFIGVFYLIGFSLLAHGLRAARRSTQVASWPTTQGTLTNVSLAEKSDNDGATIYEVQLQYTYKVAGQAHSGSRLAFDYAGSSNQLAQSEIYEKLKAAKSVDVRYDPDDPTTSALSYGIHLSIRLTLVFAVTWLVVVLGFTLIWILMSVSDKVLLENLSLR